MSFLADFFNAILYRPLLNTLILFYETTGHDIGIAVIFLTLFVRLILYPFSFRAIKSQKALNSLQPKIQEIQRKYSNDKEKQSREMMGLYKKEKINPFSGCLPLMLQLPILIALYQVFLKGLSPESLESALYSFVSYPGTINLIFLGIVNLAKPSLILALIAGFFQFLQSKMSMPKKERGLKTPDFSQMMQYQMLYFFPAFTVFLVYKLGSIIGLYWVFSTIFSVGEHYLLNRKRSRE